MRTFKQHLSDLESTFDILEQDSVYISRANNPGEELLNLETISFCPSDNYDLFDEVSEFRDSFYKPNDPNLAPYSPKSFNLEDQEVLTIFKKDEKIVGLTSAWSRVYYGRTCARILNRFWFDPAIRRTGTKVVLRLPVFIAIEQQCHILKQRGFDSVFISRPVSSKSWTSKVKDQLNKFSDIQDWQNDDKIYLVAPGEAYKECWQRIVWVYLHNNEIRSDFIIAEKNLTLEEYNERFAEKG